MEKHILFPAYPNFFGESKSARVYCFKSDKTYYSFIVGTLNGKLNTVTINNMNVAFVRFNYANGATATDIKSIIQVPDNVMFTESPYPTRRYYPYGAEYVLADNVRVYPSIESTLNPLLAKALYLQEIASAMHQARKMDLVAGLAESEEKIECSGRTLELVVLLLLLRQLRHRLAPSRKQILKMRIISLSRVEQMMLT